MDPPLYSPSTAEQAEQPHAGLLVNVCPLPNESGFVLGSLGHGTATIEGEVQVKHQTDNDQPQHTQLFDKLEVELLGREWRKGGECVVIVESRVVVWSATAPSSSSAQSTVPTSSQFRITLTDDLPHCVHLPDSALEYTLSATLSGAGVARVRRITPIHIARHSPPTTSTYNPAPPNPTTLSMYEPVRMGVKLAKTTFRQSEVIGLVVRVEIPSSKAIEHESLRLRTVSAEMIRQISVNGEEGEEQGKSGRGKESAERDWGSDDEGDTPKPPPPTHIEQTNPDEIVEEPIEAEVASSSVPGPSHETVLSRSGKSCRFSPSRPIVLKLLLHPPTLVSCESITQQSILHNISFKIRITVGLITSGNVSSRHDCSLEQVVTIVPDSAAVPPRVFEKQREVDTAIAQDEEGPVPTYHEQDDEEEEETASPEVVISSSGYVGDLTPPEGWDEEEYDGYEQLSAQAATVAPPPTIDEDVSPPSASENQPGPSGSGASLVPSFEEATEGADESLPSSVDHSPALRPLALSLVLPSSDSISLSSSQGMAAAPAGPTDTGDSLSPLTEDGLPPPYAGGGAGSLAASQPSGAGGEHQPLAPPSYSSTQQRMRLVGVTDQGVLVGLEE